MSSVPLGVLTLRHKQEPSVPPGARDPAYFSYCTGGFRAAKEMNGNPRSVEGGPVRPEQSLKRGEQGRFLLRCNGVGNVFG